MRKLSVLFFCLGLALVLGSRPAVAQESQAATTADIQRLQYDLQNLDDSLAALSTSHPRYQEFQGRADDIRDEVTYLKVELRRAQRSRTPGVGATRAEVEDLRRSIADLRGDIDAALNRRFSGRGTLPEGSEIQVRLEQPLSSRTARVEDRFEASVALPVQLEGRVVIPAGIRVRGIVRDAQPAERLVKGGRLDLTFDSIYFDDRTRTDLRTRVVSVKEKIDLGGENAKRAGIGAVLGGVIGQVIGGTKGAIIGAVLGGGGALAAKLGEDVELPAGAILTLQLERPLDVTRD
ncbi:MAG: hypothetical protein DMF80_07340 [Acidobacteria bacterium]|nr:MAG: hypothetical protein DMF80_07340 [Acidobacteriota bacterium]